MFLFFRGKNTLIEPGDDVFYLSAGKGRVRVMLQRGTQPILFQDKGWSKPKFSLITTPERAAHIIRNLRSNPDTTTFERNVHASKPGVYIFRLISVEKKD